jgi:hypothetical protein
MPLEDVIARFCNAGNVIEHPDVTPDIAPALAVTHATSVTPTPVDTEAKTEPPGSLRWLRERGCTDAGPEEVQHLLRHLPLEPSARERVLRSYVDKWLEVADIVQLPHQKQGAGRRAANMALREGKL